MTKIRYRTHALKEEQLVLFKLHHVDHQNTSAMGSALLHSCILLGRVKCRGSTILV